MTSCLKSLRRLAQASLCVSSGLALAATQPVFPVLHYDPYAVASPLAMAEGDVNGDGVIDTVYATASTTTGSSTLTSAPRSITGAALASIAAGSVPCTANSILLADLNKDSKLDAVVTCNEGTVAVLAGNGDGTFASATTYAVASAAKAVAADLNGDGYPDLVVAMNTGNTTSTFAVLLNAGTAGPIALAAPKVYGGATGSAQLMTGDLDNDGKLDVFAGGLPNVYQGPSAAVFYGNGDGTLKPPVLPAGTHSNVALADFDGDGKPDIAGVFDYSGYALDTTVSIAYWNKLKAIQLINTPLPSGVSIQPIDVNGDGHTDLVLAGSTTTILLNDGTGTLSVGRAYATPGTFYTTRKGASGVDLVFTTPRGFYTMHGDGKGGFDGLPAFLLADTAATADLNGDGITDFVGNRTDPQLVFPQLFSVAGRGDATFIQYKTFNGLAKSFPLLADTDGDGILDLVNIIPGIPGSMVQSQSGITVAKGSAGGSFAFGSFIGLSIQGPNGAVAGNFDNDGKAEIAISYLDTTAGSANVSGLVLLRHNSSGYFVTPPAVIASSTTAIASKPIAADLNNDGKLDLVWGSNAYINQGSAAFTALALPVQGSLFAAGDLNGDKIPDLVIDNAIYAGKGDGTFLATPIYTIATPQGSTLISVSIGDVNGDGNADIVLQTFSDVSTLTVVYGDGHGGFTIDANLYTTGSKQPVSGGFARLNNSAPPLAGDNRLDYLVFADNAAISLLNQTNPAPGPPALFSSGVSLSAVVNDLAPGQSTTLLSQVTGINPTGTITLKTSDGTVLSTTTALNYSGMASFQASFAVEGTYTVTANYSGDSVNAPAVSVPLTLHVAKAVTSVSLSYSGNAFPGRIVTLRAFVSGFAPTGQVTFTSGAQTLGTVTLSASRSAELPWTFADIGPHSVTASYAGDAADLPSTGTFSINIVPLPDFSMGITPGSITITAGQSAVYTLTITPSNGYNGTVALTCAPVACPGAYLRVSGSMPSTITFTFTTRTSNTGPILRYGPVAAALLLLGCRRRWRQAAPRIYAVLFAAALALGLIGTSGCSSSKDTSTPTTNPGTTYDLSITGQDASLSLSHTVGFQLVIKQP